MSQNYYLDNEDLRFYMERGVDWETLVRVTERDYRSPDSFEDAEQARAFYHDMLEMIGKFVAREIAPNIEAIEAQGSHLVDGEVVQPPEMDRIMEQMAELGLHLLAVPREFGGMNAPLLVYMLNNELLARADAAIMNHYGFHAGIAMALFYYSISEGSTTFDPETGEVLETRFQEAIEEMISGQTWGSMDITEPDAGSDMGALRTIARQAEDGSWRVTGQKVYITSGHGKYHVIIARTEGAGEDGLKSLSTFLVPAWEELPDGGRKRYIHIDRLEEKMGHHASATCAISFEDAPAHLIGNPGDGFRYMLLLMNNARIGVGFECLGISEAAYRLARDYAAERRAFGKTIDQHEMVAEMLSEMKNDIQAIRALCVDAAFHEELSRKLEVGLKYFSPESELERKQMERDQRRAARRSRRLTPLLKYVASEAAVAHARTSIQVHGGAGYIKEYGAERLLRDAMVMPIYEGTSQIQSLMAMKDTLAAMMKNPQRFVRRMADVRWRSLSEREPHARQLAKIQLLSMTAQQTLVTRTARDKFASMRTRPWTDWWGTLTQSWDPKRDFAFAMLHAEKLTRLLADEAMAEILYEQGTEHPDRMVIFERFIERALPRARYLLDQITTTGERLLEELHGLDEDDDQVRAAE